MALEGRDIVDIQDPLTHDALRTYKGKLSASACRFFEGLAAHYHEQTGYAWTPGEAVQCVLESFVLIYEQMLEGSRLVKPIKLPPGGPERDVLEWLAQATPQPMRGVKKP